MIAIIFVIIPMNSLNPNAKLTAVPRGSSSSGIPSISNTRSAPILASDVPPPSFVERDLAYLRSLGPGPMPYETSPRDPVARFKEQDVP